MNIAAVARLARVSTATVSRTINGSAKVSPETAALVQKAVQELNYHPNTNARSLGTGRSNLFGLIISDITNPFFPELVKAFEDIAIEHGQEVLIANTNYDPARMELCVNRMLQRQVDGVAIMTSQTYETMLSGLNQRGVPLVFLDTGRTAPGISTIHVDYEAGINMAMSHLLQLGHRRIAYISGPAKLPSAAIRFKAFKKCIAGNKTSKSANLIEEGDHQMNGGALAMERILDRCEDAAHRPTAVLASNDLTAIGAIGAIHARGLKVPADISVVGFDDIRLSAYTQPALTTVHLPRKEIAEMAFHALFHQYKGSIVRRGQGTGKVVQPHLVVRESTAKVAP